MIYHISIGCFSVGIDAWYYSGNQICRIQTASKVYHQTRYCSVGGDKIICLRRKMRPINRLKPLDRDFSRGFLSPNNRICVHW